MKVLIIGCGYIGSALGAHLALNGLEVFGLRRTKTLGPGSGADGIRMLTADIRKPETLALLEPDYDWVVHCVSASGGKACEYSDVYYEGTRNVISWLSARPPKRFVYTSSTGVYGQLDGSEVNEQSPTVPGTETGQILVETERLLIDEACRTGFPAVILRVAGIYGPGRAYWLDQLLAGTARIDGAGDRILNMIHREDVVGAIGAALEKGATGEVYNVVDDEPVEQGLFLEWLSLLVKRPLAAPSSVPEPRVRKRGITNKRVSNRRLRSQLGYQLRFPTFREGYASIVGA